MVGRKVIANIKINVTIIIEIRPRTLIGIVPYRQRFSFGTDGELSTTPIRQQHIRRAETINIAMLPGMTVFQFLLHGLLPRKEIITPFFHRKFIPRRSIQPKIHIQHPIVIVVGSRDRGYEIR